MRQFNHWKLNRLQKIVIKIGLWGSGLIFLFLGVTLKLSLDFGMVSEVIGAISIAFGLGLTLFEKVLWKTNIMRFALFENYWTPVLEGRWVGELTRDGKPHDFVIEIKQSFNSISCITYSKNSSSSAYATEILYNDQLKTYQLIYYWQAKTSSVQPNTGDNNIFDGFTVLEIIIKAGNVTNLAGEYFTNRQPQQTRGKIFLSFQQKELKNSF